MIFTSPMTPAQNDIAKLTAQSGLRLQLTTKVTAIKIVGKDSTICLKYTVLSAVLTMKAPLYDPNLSEAFCIQ